MALAEKEQVGWQGGQDLIGSCAGVYEATYCPEGMEVEEFLQLVEEYGLVAECGECGWYAEVTDFDDNGRCEECQDDSEEE